MGERLIFEVADRELDNGVLTMLGLDELEGVGGVGREGKQFPRRQQLALAVEGADATDDEASAADSGFGDLSDARRGKSLSVVQAASSIRSIAARTCGWRRTPVE